MLTHWTEDQSITTIQINRYKQSAITQKVQFYFNHRPLLRWKVLFSLILCVWVLHRHIIDSNCTTFQLLGQQSCQRFFCLTVFLYMSQMTKGFIMVLFFHNSQLLAERYWFVLSWKSIHLLNLLLVSVSIKRQWDCRRQSGMMGIHRSYWQ